MGLLNIINKLWRTPRQEKPRDRSLDLFFWELALREAKSLQQEWKAEGPSLGDYRRRPGIKSTSERIEDGMKGYLSKLESMPVHVSNAEKEVASEVANIYLLMTAGDVSALNRKQGYGVGCNDFLCMEAMLQTQKKLSYASAFCDTVAGSGKITVDSDVDSTFREAREQAAQLFEQGKKRIQSVFRNAKTNIEIEFRKMEENGECDDKQTPKIIWYNIKTIREICRAYRLQEPEYLSADTQKLSAIGYDAAKFS